MLHVWWLGKDNARHIDEAQRRHEVRKWMIYIKKDPWYQNNTIRATNPPSKPSQYTA